MIKRLFAYFFVSFRSKKVEKTETFNRQSFFFIVLYWQMWKSCPYSPQILVVSRILAAFFFGYFPNPKEWLHSCFSTIYLIVNGPIFLLRSWFRIVSLLNRVQAQRVLILYFCFFFKDNKAHCVHDIDKDYKLKRLQATSYKLQATSYKLQAKS